ncbi:MAG TPA: hypothetical protein VIF12_06745 [Micavibrio sp.]|jgi:hypothetical protein
MSAHIKNPLTIRFSEQNDTQAICDFHRKNPHQNVDPRKPEIVEERARNGRVLLIEQHGAIKASSIGYDFARASGNPNATWIEIGTVRSTIGGIFAFMIASHVIHEFLNSPPEEKFVTNIHSRNARVGHKFQHEAGWKIFTPSDEITTACKATKTAESRESPRIWFEATSNTLPFQARIVENAMTGGIDGRTGKIDLDLSRFPLSATFRRQVEELSHGRFGEMMEKAESLPLREARGLFEQYLNGATYFPTMKSKL